MVNLELSMKRRKCRIDKRIEISHREANDFIKKDFSPSKKGITQIVSMREQHYYVLSTLKQ